MVKLSFELDGELIDVQLSAPYGVGEFIDAALEVLSYMENFDGITAEQLVPGYKDLAKTVRDEIERFHYVCSKLNLREFAILYRDGSTFRNDAPLPRTSQTCRIGITFNTCSQSYVSSGEEWIPVNGCRTKEKSWTGCF